MAAVEAKKTGGYLKDKMLLAKTRVTSDEVQRAVLKTTSQKMKPPNEKHVDRLVAASYGHYANVKLEDIVGDLEKRLHSHETTVVLKALITLHSLLKTGSLDMGMIIARHSGLFHVAHLKEMDTTASQFINEYSRYLEERCMAVLQSGCRNKFEKTKPISVELDKMAVAQSLAASKCYTLQLDVLADISLHKAPMWGDNPCIIAACSLIIQDSKLLFVLLSKRSLWLVDHAASFNEACRQTALDNFALYSTVSKKLLRVFGKLRSQKSFLSKAAPDLTPLPDATLEQLRMHLEHGTAPQDHEIVTQSLEELIVADEVDTESSGLYAGMETVLAEAASAAGPPSPEGLTTEIYTSPPPASRSLFQEHGTHSSPPPARDLFSQQPVQAAPAHAHTQLPVQQQQVFAQQSPAQQANLFAQAPPQAQPQAPPQQPTEQTAALDDIWNAAPVESTNSAPTQPAKPVTLDDLFT